MQCTRFKHQRRHSKHKLDSVLHPEMAYPPANCLKPRFPQRHHAWRDPSLGWSSLGDLQTLVKPQIERFSKKRWRGSAPVLDTRSYLPRDPGNDGVGVPEMNIAWIRSLGTTGATFRELCHGGDRKVISSSVPHSEVSNFIEAAQKKSAVKNTKFAFPFLFRDPFPFLLSGQFFEAVNWAWLFLGLQG